MHSRYFAILIFSCLVYPLFVFAQDNNNEDFHYLAASSASNVESDKNDEHTLWRKLGADESVPRGSHVRLNMTSGEKHVKEPSPTFQSEEILRFLHGDESLHDEILAIRSSFALTKNASDFNAQVDHLFRMRQHELMGGIKSNESTVCAQLVLAAQTENATEALTQLDEWVEDVEFAKEFATRNQGLFVMLEIVQADSRSIPDQMLALSILSKAIKFDVELQQVLFALGGLDRVWEVSRRNPLLHDKSLSVFASLLRGSGSAGLTLAREHGHFVRTVVEEYVTNSNKDARVRLRAANLVSDLLEQEPSFDGVILLPCDVNLSEFSTLMAHQSRQCTTGCDDNNK